MYLQKLYSSSYTPYWEILLDEISYLEQYLNLIWKDMELHLILIYQAKASIRECDLSIYSIVHGKVPPSWKKEYAAVPHDMEMWMMWLLSTVNYFQNWIFTYEYIPETFWCPAFRQPRAIFRVLKMEYSKQGGKSILNVGIRSVPMDDYDETVGMLITGLTLQVFNS